MFSDPPITRVEEGELADIPPEARQTFYRAIRFRWYLHAFIGTLLGWNIEYAALGADVGWVYTIPLLLMAVYVHRKKWNRSTDYGALAQAKLAMDPDWPSWKRERDREAELEAIRASNPARKDGTLPPEPEPPEYEQWRENPSNEYEESLARTRREVIR